MKINTKDLMNSYQCYLSNETFSQKEPCPSPELILRCVRSELSKIKKRNIMDHISNCAQCTNKVKLVMDILNKEGQIIQELNTCLKDNKPSIHGKRFWIKHALLRPISISIGILLVVAFASYIILNRLSTPDIRRNSYNNLSLNFPVDKIVPLQRLLFRWQGPPNTKYYIIETYDSSFNLLWTSEPTKTNELFIPKEIIDKLDSNQLYFWAATAYLEDGRKLKSELAEFRIRR
jgi:hypothetical protein